MYTAAILLLLLLLSLAFAVAMLVTGFICGPHAKTELKNSSYECGMRLVGNVDVKVNPRYFVYALMFLIFDAETVLLFPFAVAFEKLGFFVFFQAVLFIFLMLVSLGYAMRKNMLRFR